MPVRNQNWYDLQEGRRYPLDDRGTGVDDTGKLIRDNILVDCHIKFPAEYGNYPYVSGLTVTGAIVTVVISAAETEEGDNSKILCAISVPKPITLSRNYAVTPIATGVAGWVAFGSGCAENFSGKYSAPKQTLIALRNARPYRQMPVQSLGKFGLPDALQDIININAAAPVVAEYTAVEIEGKQTKAVIFSLRGQFDDTEDQPLREFLGPCGARPESGTCPKEPILTINGIKPDCSGNIDINVGEGLATYLFENCGGLGISFGIGLSTFCPKEQINPDCSRTGGNPIGGADLCETSSSSSSGISSSSISAVASSSGANSSSAQPSSSSSIADNTPCLSLPYCANLTDAAAEFLINRFGVFENAVIQAPDGCAVSSSSSASSDSSASSSEPPAAIIYPSRTVIQSTSVTGFNILTLKNCATDWAINQKIAATFRLTGGPRRNGGVVVNYLTPAQTGNNTTFIAAVMDIELSQFRLLRYNGTNIVVEFAESFANSSFVYDTSKWYTAAITPTILNSNISLRCALSAFGATTPAITFEVATPNYGFVAGSAGIISNQAYTYFSHVTIGV